jgi:hypothetical protein
VAVPDDIFAERVRHSRIPIFIYKLGLSEAAIVLYGWFSARYGGFKRGMFPSIATLMQDLDWSESKVHRTQRELIKAGLLVVTRQEGTTNLYKLVADAREAARVRSKTQRPRPHGGGVSPVTGVSHMAPGGVKYGTPGVSHMAPRASSTDPAREGTSYNLPTADKAPDPGTQTVPAPAALAAPDNGNPAQVHYLHDGDRAWAMDNQTEPAEPDPVAQSRPGPARSRGGFPCGPRRARVGAGRP